MHSHTSDGARRVVARPPCPSVHHVAAAALWTAAGLLAAGSALARPQEAPPTPSTPPGTGATLDASAAAPARHGFPPLRCVVEPKERLDLVRRLHANTMQHVVLALSFDGDGDQPPKVRTVYSNASTTLQEEISDWASRFRMPCRQAGDATSVLQRRVHIRPWGIVTYQMPSHQMELARFLRLMTPEPPRQERFDFDRMGCPFKVDYTIFSPYLPNQVEIDGPEHEARAPFLAWLQARQWKFRDEKHSHDFFGQTVEVSVPCGQLDLDPQRKAGVTGDASS